MSAKLYLSIFVDPTQPRRVTLDGINLESKVVVLKQTASQEAQLPPEDIALVYCGNILEDETTLHATGVSSGVTVHVLKKVTKGPVKVEQASTESPTTLVTAFKNMIENTNYRAVLQRLNRPEVLENIMAATPGLRDDPVALAIIQDPELLSQLCDWPTVFKVMSGHPSLVEAAHSIAALVHEEAASNNLAQGPPTAYSYTLDAFSEDDDMESSQSSDSQTHHLFTEITPEYLAAMSAAQAESSRQEGEAPPPAHTGPITSEMISNALGQAFTLASSSSDSQPHNANSVITAITSEYLASLSAAQAESSRQEGGAPPPAHTGPITSEMISNALGQAFTLASSVTAPQSTPSQPRQARSQPRQAPYLPRQANTTPRPDLTDFQLSRQLAEQHLRQMHELGLRNDTLNLQALQATEFNVQEAINLVFSGAMTDNDPSNLD